jgi:hypothetical protein
LRKDSQDNRSAAGSSIKSGCNWFAETPYESTQHEEMM